MEHFEGAKFVRLRNAHGKYLWAEDNMVGVSQDRETGPLTLWTVETGDGFVKLKSSFDTYLAASSEPFLLGMTGKKVVQARRGAIPDSAIEWEPVGDTESGRLVKLKTRHGNYLRANGGVPPWRNSITHDVPVRSATRNWVLWEVEVVQKASPPARASAPASPTPVAAAAAADDDAISEDLSSKPKLELQLSFRIPKSDGRLISYCLLPAEGAEGAAAAAANDESQWPSFHFKGKSVSDLAASLKQELGVDEDIIVCTRNAATGKLYPLQLGLPPNNAPMHLVVLKAGQTR